MIRNHLKSRGSLTNPASSSVLVKEALRKTLPGNSSRFAPRTPSALPIVAKDLLLFREVSYHFPATTGTENRNIATFGVRTVTCFGRPPARQFRSRWLAMMVKRVAGV